MVMTRFRIALIMELLSLVSLQQKLFAFVNQYSSMQGGGGGGGGDGPFQNDTAVADALFCLENRGHRGKWMQNWNDQSRYAGEDSFQPAEDVPWQTSLLWQEETGCQVEKLNVEGWCSLMRDLNISNIYTVGDASMIDFAESLRSILFNSTALTELPDVDETIVLPCGLLHENIEFHKLQELGRDSMTMMENESIRNLVILSVDTQMQFMDDFRSVLGDILEWVDEWRRPNDLVFYRSGLPSCVEESNSVETQIAPRNNVGNARLEAFNRFAKRVLPEERVGYLNLYDASILRYDDNACNPLHHKDVSDLSVHIMYSSLLDVRQLEQQYFAIE